MRTRSRYLAALTAVAVVAATLMLPALPASAATVISGGNQPLVVDAIRGQEAQLRFQYAVTSSMPWHSFAIVLYSPVGTTFVSSSVTIETSTNGGSTWNSSFSSSFVCQRLDSNTRLSCQLGGGGNWSGYVFRVRPTVSVSSSAELGPQSSSGELYAAHNTLGTSQATDGTLDINILDSSTTWTGGGASPRVTVTQASTGTLAWVYTNNSGSSKTVNGSSSMTFAAPAGMTFTSPQSSLAAQLSTDGGSTWGTGFTLSSCSGANTATLTCSGTVSSFSWPAGALVRFRPNLKASASAALGDVDGAVSASLPLTNGQTLSISDGVLASTIVSPLSVAQSANVSALSEPPAAGQTITYPVTVTNVGTVTLTGVSISSSVSGATVGAISWPAAAGTLAAGQSATATITSAVAQADLDAGHVEHGVSASGTTPAAETVTASAAPVDTALTRNPLLSIVSTVDESALSAVPMPGEQLSYATTISNSGNVTLDGLSVAASLPGATVGAVSWPGAVGVLAPGAHATVTVAYPITQADIDLGSVTMVVSTAGSDPVDASVVAQTADLVTDLVQLSEIALAVVPDGSALSAPPVAGEQLSYAVTVTNSGNVSVSGVTLASTVVGAVLGAISWPGAVGDLGAGQSATAVATYSLTQADIDSASRAYGFEASGTSATAEAVFDEVTGSTALARAASVTVSAPAVTTGLSSPVRVGNTISFPVTVVNSGNVTISGVTLTSSLTGAVLSALVWEGAPGTLAAGGGQVTGTVTYAITQADIDAGHLPHTLTASGTAAGGAAVSAAASTDTPLSQTLSVWVTAPANSSGLSNPPQAGELMVYEVRFENTGTVTLTGLQLTSSLPGAAIGDITWPGTAGRLGAGEFATVMIEVAITQAQIDAGLISHFVTVTGTSSTAGNVAEDSTPTDTPLGRQAVLSVTAPADVSGLSSPVVAGEEITYPVTITNTGNVTITGLSLTSSLAGAVVGSIVWPGVPGELAPNAQATALIRYAVTQSDIDAGSVSHTATATGAGVAAAAVTANAAATATPVGSAVVSVINLSGVLTEPLAPGAQVSWTATLRNDGNQTVTQISPQSAQIGSLTVTWPDPAQPGRLLPGQTASVAGVSALTQDDIDHGFTSATMTATGLSPSAQPATALDATGTADAVGIPSIEVSSTLNGWEVDNGQVVDLTEGVPADWTFTVTNTGDVTLHTTEITIGTPQAITTSVGSTVGVPAFAAGSAIPAAWTDEIAPGQSRTFTRTVTPALGANLITADIVATAGYYTAAGSPVTVSAESTATYRAAAAPKPDTGGGSGTAGLAHTGASAPGPLVIGATALITVLGMLLVAAARRRREDDERSADKVAR